MSIYRKKLTADIAWLRPVTAETPLMRVQGIADAGDEEQSSLGRYVRFRGRFMASAFQQATADDIASASNDRERASMEQFGVLRDFQSYAAIFPSVVSDWLVSYFDKTKGERPDATDDPRTGLTFKPVSALEAVRFVVDIGLQPPKGVRPSERGYEFVMKVAYADERYNPMGDMQQQLGNVGTFGAPQLSLAEPGAGSAFAAEQLRRRAEAEQAA